MSHEVRTLNLYTTLMIHAINCFGLAHFQQEFGVLLGFPVLFLPSRFSLQSLPLILATSPAHFSACKTFHFSLKRKSNL